MDFVLEYLTNPNKRVFWGFLLSSFIIALICVYVKKDRSKRILFSSKLWWHPSARVDYVYFLFSYFIKVFMIYPVVVSAKTIALGVNSFMIQEFGFYRITSLSYGSIMILYTLCLFVVSDFTRYWTHRFLHTIPFLWHFHKVHHSAKVLNPLTFYRVHPVENILFGFRYSLSIGVVTGVFIYYFGAMLSLFDIFGVNIFIFVFSLIGTNLRHSHVKFTYFSFLEKWLISPYMHQIHHSTKHFDRNYGGYLAIWDRLFNTLTLSKDVKSMKFGLRKEQMKDYDNIFKLFFTPFFSLLKRKQR
ncbi:fatty acid hydroxylase superfamily protein [Malaciobacter molluscorum LMG 25693]|uniref:Fatty acid hydroxylase superfamily protein n=1 Tax=Malaciobacter molluscorum LMG 25693 TaxID=870501 RepID=A0AB33GR34_9BACT|nr:sterol desaturase family protein [Malaciobacter molluscorum]AXX91678.1 fatty acid hydroxylase superfamily protein [Malaciobacter molluscorum LMG 25693]